jgi:hypothetical protein
VPQNSLLPSGPSRPFDRIRYPACLFLFVCQRQVPFDIATWPEFRRFCLSLNPSIKSSLASSQSTLFTHVTGVYDIYRERLRSDFQDARSSIHIFADLWASPQTGFIGVHAQWVDENYQKQKMLIGLSECRFSHSGPQLALYIIALIREFNIGRKIGYFTADNAGSYDACLQAISTALQDNYKVSRFILFPYFFKL